MNSKINENKRQSEVGVLDNTNQLFVFAPCEDGKGHALCIGPTRSGKSAITSEILTSVEDGDPCFNLHNRFGEPLIVNPFNNHNGTET